LVLLAVKQASCCPWIGWNHAKNHADVDCPSPAPLRFPQSQMTAKTAEYQGFLRSDASNGRQWGLMRNIIART
jgi:hypothetical protein